MRLGITGGAPFEEHRNDPVGFIREVLHEDPWNKQEEIAEALRLTGRVTVASCNGAGKSTLAAWIILWFMLTRSHAKVVTTATRFKQVKQLWRKVRAAHAKRSNFPGTVNQTEWELDPEWYALGLSPDTEEAFQGFHSDGGELGDDGGLLVVVDEASGIRPFIYSAMMGFASTGNTMFLMIGNPNIGEGPFFETHQSSAWTRFQISAFDVPERILSRAWIEEMRETYSEDEPQWIVRVLGQFPPTGGDYQLFPAWLLEESTTATTSEMVLGRHMGVDCARGQSDKNVVVVMIDGECAAVESWLSQDAMVSVDKIAEIAQAHGVPGDCVHVDADGLGGPMVDELRRRGLPADAIHGGANPVGDWDWLIGSESNVLNRRAELYWAARRAMMDDMTRVPPRFKQVRQQLGWANYEFQKSSGKLKVEAKDDIKARHSGMSPDFADAWAYAHSRVSSQGGIELF